MAGAGEHELRVVVDEDHARVVGVVESCVAKAQLRVTLKDTLRAYPGCVHWHFKHAQDKGTLELTLWPARRRLWFKVASNRAGPWIPAAVERLKVCIEGALRS